MASLRCRIIECLLPLTGLERELGSEEVLRRRLPRLRARGPAVPSKQRVPSRRSRVSSEHPANDASPHDAFDAARRSAPIT